MCSTDFFFHFKQDGVASFLSQTLKRTHNTNKQRWLPQKCMFLHKEPERFCFIFMKKCLTDSSSFSMPLGICGTARLIAEYSVKSGNSSAIWIFNGFEGSRALARNDNFDIFLCILGLVWFRFSLCSYSCCCCCCCCVTAAVTPVYVWQWCRTGICSKINCEVVVAGWFFFLLTFRSFFSSLFYKHKMGFSKKNIFYLLVRRTVVLDHYKIIQHSP